MLFAEILRSFPIFIFLLQPNCCNFFCLPLTNHNFLKQHFFLRSASKCIKDSDVGYLVSESKFLIIDSLLAFVKHLISGSSKDDAGDGAGGGGDGKPDGGDGLELPSAADGAARWNRDNPALFFQEMLVRITIQVGNFLCIFSACQKNNSLLSTTD